MVVVSAKTMRREPLAIRRRREHAEQRRRAALLHDHRDEERVARARGEQPLEHVLVELRAHVVDRRLEHDDVVGARRPPTGSPTTMRSRFGRSSSTRSPRAVADRGDAQLGHRLRARERRDDRRPVGVTSSHGPSSKRTGRPRSSSTTAGGGTGSGPCAERATPLSQRQRRRVDARRRRGASKPRHALTTSTIASSAPTSWNSTSSGGDAVDAALGLREPREDGERVGAHALGERAPLEQRPDLAVGPVHVVVRMRVGRGSSGCTP